MKEDGVVIFRSIVGRVNIGRATTRVAPTMDVPGALLL
jgi:hypothetical protein